MMLSDGVDRTPIQEIVREREVYGFLRLVDDFGRNSESFFSRLYRGLRRKPATRTVPDRFEPDTEAMLRAANAELSAQLRQAELKAQRANMVFDYLQEGVILQSPEGKVVIINEAAKRLIGSMRAFWESELGRLFQNAQKAQFAGSEMQPVGAIQRVQLNDRILGAQLAVVFAEDGAALGTLIVLRDETREALADRLKDQFVTQITHELRTPLTAIKGMSEVLLSSPTDKPPNRKFLEAIGRNTATLDRMITELLDISEISGGSLAVKREPLDLQPLLLDVIALRKTQLERSGVQIGLMIVNRGGLQILGDERRLRWALGHLLDNAINYTLKGGRITLRVGATRADKVLVDVIDTGVGIAERDQAHVFERFYRGEARTSDGKLIDPRGLGQGLFIARAVAEAHDGFLTFSSAVGQGSKFTLGLPMLPHSAA